MRSDCGKGYSLAIYYVNCSSVTLCASKPDTPPRPEDKAVLLSGVVCRSCHVEGAPIETMSAAEDCTCLCIYYCYVRVPFCPVLLIKTCAGNRSGTTIERLPKLPRMTVVVYR